MYRFTSETPPRTIEECNYLLTYLLTYLLISKTIRNIAIFQHAFLILKINFNNCQRLLKGCGRRKPIIQNSNDFLRVRFIEQASTVYSKAHILSYSCALPHTWRQQYSTNSTENYTEFRPRFCIAPSVALVQLLMNFIRLYTACAMARRADRQTQWP